MPNLPLCRPILPALFLAVVFGAACRDEPPVLTRTFDGAAALRYVERQVAFGPRIPGSAGHQAMATWLDTLLRTRADTVIAQRWSHVTVKGDTLPLANFIARFNPAAPKRLLYLAHWDTRPKADAPGSSDSTKPVPGANDGGSGVAVLLGVADALRRQPLPPGLGVDLLFVDGEDYGSFTKTPKDVLIGSRHFAANQPPGPRPLYAVLFDMVGDKDLQLFQEGNSSMGAPEVVELVWNTAREFGHGDVFVARPKHTLIDDHVELQKAGLRAIDIVDFDYPAWHTPDDTIDKVSAASLGVVGTVALALIQREES
jgi:glutaminyl-peptide cyclotransferase